MSRGSRREEEALGGHNELLKIIDRKVSRHTWAVLTRLGIDSARAATSSLVVDRAVTAKNSAKAAFFSNNYFCYNSVASDASRF